MTLRPSSLSRLLIPPSVRLRELCERESKTVRRLESTDENDCLPARCSLSIINSLRMRRSAQDYKTEPTPMVVWTTLIKLSGAQN